MKDPNMTKTKIGLKEVNSHISGCSREYLYNFISMEDNNGGFNLSMVKPTGINNYHGGDSGV